MQTREQIKADAINEFVGHMIGALESGFIDENTVTLAQIHRVSQNYVKDSFNIELPHITEQWGETVAKICGHPINENSDDKVLDAVLKELKQQHSWRLESQECGGDEIVESYGNLKARLVEDLIYAGASNGNQIKQVQDS